VPVNGTTQIVNGSVQLPDNTINTREFQVIIMQHDNSQRPVIKSLITGLLLVPLTLQAAVPNPPDAGTILQQMKPAPAPAAASRVPVLRLESQPAHELPAGTPFTVNTISISGNTLFDTATLHELVAEGEGKNSDLSQLNKLAAHITEYYHRHGFLLARAVIQAQTIHNGVVNIDIIEARYGHVTLDNHSWVSDSFLQKTLSHLQSGEIINQAQIDNILLLLSDLPGVDVNATLKPGDTAGTSDLQVNTSSTTIITGNLALDNYGNRYTGRVRGGGTISIANPLHYGDVLSASALSSGGGLVYGRVAYEAPFNGYGSRVGSSFLAVDYVLGDNLKPLDAHGIAYVWNLWVRHPFIRSPGLSLYGQYEFDHKRLHDRIGTGAIRDDRFVNDTAISLSGDIHDDFLSGGINSFSVSANFGHLHFNDPIAVVNDHATAKTVGGFMKLGANISRLQTLTPKNTLYVAASVQLTNDNLDSAEKMAVGGPYTVRAYDMAAVSGDNGYMATAELRHDFGEMPYGRWQALVFIDSAHIKVNQKPWTAGLNSATLTGAGGGINWTGPYRLAASLYVATPLGSVPALVDSSNSTRAWFEISKRY